MKKLKIGTLFSGGLAAVEWAMKYEEFEHEIVFACEWDKYARKSYLAFHGEPSSAFYEDVTHMDGSPYLDSIDLMVWGSPCQDLSLAGKRKGFDGEKSSLFREGARIMSEVMPKVFIFENVKGLLSSNSGADYKEVEKTFRELGYHMAMKVVNAKEQGTAQNRERVFVVGFLDVDTYHDFSFADSVPLTKCLRDYLEEDVDEKYSLSQKMIDGFISSATGDKLGFINQDTQASIVFTSDGVSPSLCSGTHGYAQGYVKIERWVNKDVGSVLSDVCPTLRASSGTDIRKMPRVWIKSAVKCGYEVATIEDSINFTHPRSDTRRGIVGKSVAQTLDCACNQGVIIGAIRGRNPENPKSRVAGLPTRQMLELNENGTSNCLTSVQKDNVVVESKTIPTQLGNSAFCLRASEPNGLIEKTQNEFRIRRLTPRECFRLMGLCDSDIVLVNSDTQSYKIAGNGIEINTMRSIIRQLYRPVKSSLSLF